MKINAISIAAGFILILVIAATGCIEVPKSDIKNATVSQTPRGPTHSATTIPTTPSYVTIVTPFETVTKPAPVVITQGYSVFPVPSPVPADQTCLIYTQKQTYTYNGTAFSFDLKNPPMYIDYSVIPTYVDQYTLYVPAGSSKTYTDQSVMVTSEYSPYSWFVITVRNKTTGEIYLQDGFGKDYRQYMNATLTVLNRDDLQVEFSGNQITATANIWVKPLGNFDTSKNLSFSNCKNWGVPNNVLDSTAIATPAPTWQYSIASTTAPTTNPTPRPN